MKKIVKICCLALWVLILTGCVDYQLNMGINEDKSVDISISAELDMYEYARIMLVDGGMWELVQEDMLEDNCALNCPYDTNTEEYDACINSCMGNATIKSEPTEEDIKNYLDLSGFLNTEEMISEEEIAQLESMGYTVEYNFDEENYLYTATLKQHFANIDDISTNEEFALNLEELFNPQEEEFNNIYFTKTTNNTYKVNYVLDESVDNSSQMPDVDLSELLTFNCVINLPNGAISNNATTVSNDGKTLTWDLVSGNINSINLEFSFEEPGLFDNISDEVLRIIALALIMGGSLGIVITVIVFIKRSKMEV